MDVSEKNQMISNAISVVAKKALRSSFSSKKGRTFFTGAAFSLKSASKKRDAYEQKGIHIPPFLIASIAAECNLQCTGCYARANGSINSKKFGEMTGAEWENIFSQAADLGISFIILAGGEPMMRKDVLTAASRFPSIIFPVLTNGTLFSNEYLDFFDNNRNLVPILSIEGDRMLTDSRRGEGVSDLIQNAAKEMKASGLLFGVSITVTTQNLEFVTDSAFVSELEKNGCTVLFYVEYVPADGNCELAPEADDFNLIGQRVSDLRDQFIDMIILSFPGDEKYLGGCLAAGNGFFHINAYGGAEPCPFSPYSDMNLKNHTLLEAIESPLFEKIKAEKLLEGEHIGGCTLFEKKEQVESFISPIIVLKNKS